MLFDVAFVLLYFHGTILYYTFMSSSDCLLFLKLSDGGLVLNLRQSLIVLRLLKHSDLLDATVVLS